MGAVGTFRFDLCTLPPEAEALRGEVREFLRETLGDMPPVKRARSWGGFDREFSRAVAARAYLVSVGIPADRLRTVSYGKEFPFDPGHDDAAWAKNRRAHFVVTAK